jgi:hypothetical protein
MVSVPVLGSVVVFAATTYVTVPLSLPLAPAVTVIHDTLLVAVHPQPVVVVIAEVSVVSVAETL